MSETWHILYVKVNSQEQVATKLKRLMSSKKSAVAIEWPSVQSKNLFGLPMFCFWVSPVIQGWISICRDFPPLAVTTKEIVSTLNCLAFECWIGVGNWGYLLHEGQSIVDRFDSNPRQTILYEYLFSEWWERDSPYAALEAGELAPEQVEETFGGHPERLTSLPLRKGTVSEQLREIMDSTALFQTDIVDRFAECINLPNFTPGLLDSEYIKMGLRYLASPDSWDTKAKEIAEAIKQIEEFVPIVFRPAPVTRYREWIQSLSPLAREVGIEAAIRWYEAYSKIASPDMDRLVAENELDALRTLR